MDVTGAVWRTSSYSSPNGGNCVQAAAVWRTSSHSSANGGACVQVARGLPPGVAVRDSKDAGGPVLAVTPGAWRAFIRQVKDGRFGPA